MQSLFLKVLESIEIVWERNKQNGLERHKWELKKNGVRKAEEMGHFEKGEIG